jgi:hypothetical protein
LPVPSTSPPAPPDTPYPVAASEVAGAPVPMAASGEVGSGGGVSEPRQAPTGQFVPKTTYGTSFDD